MQPPIAEKAAEKATDATGSAASYVSQRNSASAVEALFPGHVLTFETADGGTLTATVYPLGVFHIRKFTDKILSLVSSVGIVAPTVAGGSKGDHNGTDVTISLMAASLVDGFADLIGSCVRFSVPDIRFDQLPAHVALEIATVWMEENFGEKKASTWRTFVQTIAAKFAMLFPPAPAQTKAQTPTSDSQMPYQRSSQPDSVGPTS